MDFWECGIADKDPKVVIFENTYLWVTFTKSFIFCIFMLIYVYFEYLCYIYVLAYFSNARFEVLVKLS